jgi:hypothetical protein
MKILEIEQGGGISRRVPKLAISDLQRSGVAEPNWNVELGRLVDRARGKGVAGNLELITRSFPQRMAAVGAGSAQAYPYEPDEVREIFDELADRWEVETEFLSMTPQITGHPAYFEIVALGFPAVPLILGRLQKNVRLWFQALVAMTRENPAADAETNSAAARLWIEWGQQQGLID